MANEIILASIGSLGDLNPFIAVALELEARGNSTILAVPEDQVESVRSAGLKAHAILPSNEVMNQELGMTSADVTRAMMDDINFVVENVMLKFLEFGVTALDDITSDAVGIVGTIMTLPAAIISEKRSIPYISAALQPMTLPTVYDAPRVPEYWMLASPRFGMTGRVWNRMWMPIIRAETKRRFAKTINSVREVHDLPRLRRAPLLEVEIDPVMTVAMYSSQLAPLQPDHPKDATQTGFATFDHEGGTQKPLDDELLNFLDAGEPPIVFSLGSFAVNLPGEFYPVSYNVAQELGERAVLLTGSATDLTSTSDILVREYAPYSQLFPKSKCVVHHGGVGTTGQAMRAGVPQLITPHLGDQWDNGARIKSLGLGDTLPANKYCLENAMSAIRNILSSADIAGKAAQVAENMRLENGAQSTAVAIETALHRA